MALFTADGTEMTDANVTTVVGSAIPGNATYKVTADVWEDFTFTGNGGTSRRLKFHKNQIITKAQYDEALASAKDA